MLSVLRKQPTVFSSFSRSTPFIWQGEANIFSYHLLDRPNLIETLLLMLTLAKNTCGPKPTTKTHYESKQARVEFGSDFLINFHQCARGSSYYRNSSTLLSAIKRVAGLSNRIKRQPDRKLSLFIANEKRDALKIFSLFCRTSWSHLQKKPFLLLA